MKSQLVTVVKPAIVAAVKKQAASARIPALQPAAKKSRCAFVPRASDSSLDVIKIQRVVRAHCLHGR
eukprot:351009-Chlamydomonas_euryale.AAC.4